MTALSIGLLAAQTGSQYFGQRDQANAALAQSGYQSSIYRQSATLADAQARDAIARGDEGADQVEANTRQAVGAARAAAGAGGVSADVGSSADVQSQTRGFGALDALTVQNNAARQAYGYKVDAANDRQQAELATRAGKNTAAQLRAGAWGTLLTGATQAYGEYDQWKRNQPASLSVPTPPRGGYNVFRK